MSKFPSEDSINLIPFDQYRSTILYTSFPWYIPQHLNVLRQDETKGATLNRYTSFDVDELGITGFTLGNTAFYRYLNILHPVVTEALHFSDSAQPDRMIEETKLLAGLTANNITCRELLDEANTSANLAEKLFVKGSFRESFVSLFMAASTLLLSRHYRQHPKLIMMIDLFKTYDDDTAVKISQDKDWLIAKPNSLSSLIDMVIKDCRRENEKTMFFCP